MGKAAFRGGLFFVGAGRLTEPLGHPILRHHNKWVIYFGHHICHISIKCLLLLSFCQADFVGILSRLCRDLIEI